MVKVLRGSWARYAFSLRAWIYICPMEYWNRPSYKGEKDSGRWRGFIDYNGSTNFSHTHYGDTRRGDRNQNW